jgi:hypothetical protein
MLLQARHEEGIGWNYTGSQDSSAEEISKDLQGERIGTACISTHHGWIYRFRETLPSGAVTGSICHHWPAYIAR